MKHKIGLNLDLIQLPRHAELGDYDWFDIELEGIQVGKSRCRIESSKFTIFSIMIYPEFVLQGYARTVIDYLKTLYPLIYADRVRFTARDFLLKMDFLEESECLFVWHRSLSPPLESTSRLSPREEPLFEKA